MYIGWLGSASHLHAVAGADFSRCADFFNRSIRPATSASSSSKSFWYSSQYRIASSLVK
jgi:hypothetical protein